MLFSRGLLEEGGVWSEGLVEEHGLLVRYGRLLEEDGLKSCLLEMNGVVLRSAGQENGLICSGGGGS